MGRRAGVEGGGRLYDLASLVHPEVVFSLRYRDRGWGLSCT